MSDDPPILYILQFKQIFVLFFSEKKVESV